MQKTSKKLIRGILAFLAKGGEKTLRILRKHPVAAACLIVGLVAVVAPQLLTQAVLSAFGFGVKAGGVGAATVASCIQSVIGNVVAGSVFATLQSAGAGGVGLAAVSGVVQPVVVLGAAAAAVYFWSRK